MWTCRYCGAETEDDSWQKCWKCDLERDASDQTIADFQARMEQAKTRISQCSNCDTQLTYAGRKVMAEKSTLGFWLGDLGELFGGTLEVDVYFCKSCGKAEFYLGGVGEDWREHS